PQKPLRQSWLQHSVTAPQVWPSGLHSVPPQKPFTQSSLQQSVVSAHDSPSGLHTCSGRHLPPTQLSPAQQRALASQAAPRSPQLEEAPPPSESRLPRAPHAGPTAKRSATKQVSKER